MWAVTTTLELDDGTAWRTSGLHINALILATLQRMRTNCISGDTEDLRQYLDHLLAVLDVVDRDRERAICDFAVHFCWKENAKSYSFSCLRGEIVLITVLLVQHLLKGDVPADWQLGIRLVRWVALPQMNAWVRKDLENLPPSCSEQALRKLLTMGLLRLQTLTLWKWESTGAKGNNGARIAKWALFYAHALSKTIPAMRDLADEMQGLLWLHAQHLDDPILAQRLLATALAHFERMGHTDRIEQIRHKRVPGHTALTVPEAQRLMAPVKPLCVAARYEPLAKPYTSSKTLRALVEK